MYIAVTARQIWAISSAKFSNSELIWSLLSLDDYSKVDIIRSVTVSITSKAKRLMQTVLHHHSNYLAAFAFLKLTLPYFPSNAKRVIFLVFDNNRSNILLDSSLIISVSPYEEDTKLNLCVTLCAKSSTPATDILLALSICTISQR